MKSPKDIEKTVSSICSCHKGIAAAYIFGSAVKSGSGEPRDIDLALLLEEASLHSFDIPSLISEFEKATDFRVDVVVLNRADEILKYQVRKTAFFLYDNSVRKPESAGFMAC